MKLFELHADDQQEMIDEIVSALKRNCRQFLRSFEANEHTQLWRGTTDATGDFDKLTMRSERLPMNSPIYFHTEMNKFFKEKFGWKARDGIFCAGRADTVKAYGPCYAIFPIEEFKYVWSERIQDTYSDIVHGFSYNDEDASIDDQLKSLRRQLEAAEFKNNELENALKYYRTHEVMLYAPEYFAVSEEMVKKIDWESLYATL